ncbi:ketopantoate reductase family protein [Citricoccus muralis]|uniref:2-dehydropantoate 2-reductase n=1 Tax=Citricoccus muralis TaxID=169134 RepID=A0ABY8H4T4_9MICC|nr:2-dehydropantoate 2-reductase [Citricoccus muralis]WFP16149.1 2-dehydropantoate 2-reductase [Citricoccus muralis]
MRILMVGAGGTGGAFGTYLHEAGREVTFLVRSERAERLRRDGLRFVSSGLDRTHPVNLLVRGEETAPFDLVVLAVKATALDSALDDIAPYVGPDTLILPILNGMAHLDLVEQRYPGRTLGGFVRIVATLDGDTVHQLTPLCGLTVGSLTEEPLPAAVVEALDVPGIDFAVRDDIRSALWEKWMFIAAAGVTTCLFRGPIGDIIDAGGLPHIHATVQELEAVAAHAGYPVSEAAQQASRAMLTEPGSEFTSSLYRDLVAGYRTEAEHLLGDLARRARELGSDTPLLDLALVQIRTVSRAVRPEA